MTAEIAILNKRGVALAADSAVTIGNRKVYNSANKLFTLSKYHPVGVMVYGNAEFLGVSWETIIKHYRNNVLRRRELSTLQDYADDFLKFLRRGRIFSAEDRRLAIRRNLAQALLEVRAQIVDRIQNYLEKNAKIPESEIEKIINAEINDRHKFWSGTGQVKGVTNRVRTRVGNTIRPHIRPAVEEVFEKIPLRAVHKRKLSDICLFSFIKERHADWFSGIVFAGYGRDELFPSASSFAIDCLAGTFLKYAHVQTQSEMIHSDNTAAIIPYAQREMVDAFISGIDPSLKIVIEGYVSKIFSEIPGLLLPKSSAKKDSKRSQDVHKAVTQILKDFRKQINDYQRKQFVNPILEAVDALPIADLAQMAEALVSLTSFKRKVTMETESVGGEIDVAVISKGDGFIWIKRKHYFRPELNHHFMTNYFRSSQ